MVICVVAVPFTGGTSLALANLALISTDIVISEVDNNINEAWESMTEAERNQHKTGYSAWKTFHSGWNTMNTVVAVGSLATLARSGALALNRYARLLRVNARFNNFVKSGSSFFAAISKKTFGKSFTAFNQRMGRFVGWGASGAGRFTSKQIDDYVALATKQGNKSKVMLGKFENGGALGYKARAGTEYTFFDFENKWDEAYNLVNKNDDEIWRINQKFIDNQKALGKEFYLSHDPSIATGFYFREVQYLTKPIVQGGLGGKIQKQGIDLWKIVW